MSVTTIQDKFVVSVMFDGSTRTYDYISDIPLRVGDSVVVDTRRGEATVEVVEIKSNSDRASAKIKRRAA